MIRVYVDPNGQQAVVMVDSFTTRLGREGIEDLISDLTAVLDGHGTPYDAKRHA